MRTKPCLTASDAEAIMVAATAFALKNQWKVSIAVVDDTGALMRFDRLDHADAVTCDVAILKARTAALTRRPSKFWSDVAKTMPGVTHFPNILAVPGGLPILVQGECVGGIAASGAKGDEDELVAAAGVAAL